MHKIEKKIIRSVGCPECGVIAGEPCKDKAGPHGVRRMAWQRKTTGNTYAHEKADHYPLGAFVDPMERAVIPEAIRHLGITDDRMVGIPTIRCRVCEQLVGGVKELMDAHQKAHEEAGETPKFWYFSVKCKRCGEVLLVKYIGNANLIKVPPLTTAGDIIPFVVACGTCEGKNTYTADETEPVQVSVDPPSNFRDLF